MKVNSQTRQEIRENAQIVLDALRAKHGVEFEPKTFSVSKLNDLWFRTWASIAYPDDNPNVLKVGNGERLLAFNPNYPLYPCGTNDDTLATALKSIAKELR